jgi:hypothetical protein
MRDETFGGDKRQQLDEDTLAVLVHDCRLAAAP